MTQTTKRRETPEEIEANLATYRALLESWVADPNDPRHKVAKLFLEKCDKTRVARRGLSIKNAKGDVLLSSGSSVPPWVAGLAKCNPQKAE